LSSLQRELDCPITRIGEFTEPASGIVLADVHGRECAIGRLGFEHFAQRPRPRR